MTPHDEAPRPTFTIARREGVAVVEFSEGHYNNPFPRRRMRELAATIASLDSDDSVRAMVLYGGAGRSFSAGGDFNETSSFTGGEEIGPWIDDITDLYQASLETTTPVVVAIDGYAIGLGLQLALTADYRIGAQTCVLKMPEFKLGIACNFGGFMLTEVVGREVMQEMLFSCEEWPAPRALEDGLLHRVVPPESLLAEAEAMAARLAGYPVEPLSATKPHLNAGFVAGLNRVREVAKECHRRSFAAGAPQQNMRRVIKAEAGVDG
jgi:enoyl-CoA hydratase/carnithine racemase